jgi:hypothetical protein
MFMAFSVIPRDSIMLRRPPAVDPLCDPMQGTINEIRPRISDRILIFWKNRYFHGNLCLAEFFNRSFEHTTTFIFQSLFNRGMRGSAKSIGNHEIKK